MSNSNIAIIVAAGQGKRMGSPKSFMKIAGKPLLWWTISTFQKTKVIDSIILVVNQKDINRAKKLKFSKIIKIVAGGKERQDSVFNGLRAVPQECEIVAIHDGARPCITSGLISEAVRSAKKFGAAIVGIPAKDTIKQILNPKSEIRNKSKIKNLKFKTFIVGRTLERERLWQAQTPQVFHKEIIQKAYRLGYNKHQATDDSFLVEKAGYPVRLIAGSYENIKVTTAEDLVLAEAILRRERS